ncbi:hypothetical protein IJO12_07705 [bacterium]|nr:hypothetical protein [bacterium]
MKRIALLFSIVFSVLSVQAEDNVLQTIEIDPVKDTYNIVLVTDKAVDVKKTVQAPNKINLELKGVRASKALNTIYNNVSNVDTVMVENQGNGVSIFFQADNAQNATVSFDSLIPVVSKKQERMPSEQSIKLNNPIESYAPIYKEELEPQKTSDLFNKLTSNSAILDIKDTLEEEGVGAGLSKFFSFAMVACFVIAAVRMIRRKEPEMKIGLSQQQFAESPVDMFNPLSHQLKTNKPFTTINYGLNAYKNENRNPYEQDMHFHNPNLRNIANQIKPDESLTKSMSVSRPATKVSAEVQKQTVNTQKRMTSPVTTAPVNQNAANIDNLKFLESMTAIYEKSGRYDLARGLQKSLSKNNII